MLDAVVIVEVLQVPQIRDGGGDVGVQVGGAMPGDVHVAGGGHGGGAHPVGDA
ncbi:hypothetical protein L843_3216, partial [Mycobacterium intracellulare MIN_061107_1834]